MKKVLLGMLLVLLTLCFVVSCCPFCPTLPVEDKEPTISILESSLESLEPGTN